MNDKVILSENECPECYHINLAHYRDCHYTCNNKINKLEIIIEELLDVIELFAVDEGPIRYLKEIEGWAGHIVCDPEMGNDSAALTEKILKLLEERYE